VWRNNEGISCSREAARCSESISLKYFFMEKQKNVGMSSRVVCGTSGCKSIREAGLSMANNKRGPEPGSPKAKHGGQAVRAKYGPEFYSRIGKKGGEKVKEKRGPQFYAEIGKKGGESTKRQQGSEFYSRIGKKGGEHGRAAAEEQE
jgi:general stress protein YciG